MAPPPDTPHFVSKTVGKNGVLKTEYKQDMVTLLDMTPPPSLATPSDEKAVQYQLKKEKCEPLKLTVTTKVKANAVKQEYVKQNELKRSVRPRPWVPQPHA